MGKAVSNVLFGEKTPGSASQIIDTSTEEQRNLQSELLKQYQPMIGQDFSANQLAQQEAQARAGVEDQTRLAKQMVAQRGLGNTSLGLNAILGQGRGLGEKIEQIRANQPMQRLQNLGAISGGIGNIIGQQNQSKIFSQGYQAQPRSGGLMAALLPAAGMAVGGMLGGPAGASAGGAIGSSMAGKK